MVRTLIIENNPKIQKIIERLYAEESLLPEKGEIIIAKCLKEAQRKSENSSQTIDLIIVDKKTSEEELNKLYKWLKDKNLREVPVVIVDSSKEITKLPASL